jgi:hypothetical protein
MVEDVRAELTAELVVMDNEIGALPPPAAKEGDAECTHR